MSNNSALRRYLKKSYTKKRKINTNMKIQKRKISINE
jgi:hypothetical protein